MPAYPLRCFVRFTDGFSGVPTEWPAGRTVIPVITPAAALQHLAAVGDSAAPDVTGGMAAKVSAALSLAQSVPGLESLIFSGEMPGNVYTALMGEHLEFGTTITAPKL